MKILTKLMLASAVMVTSGFAGSQIIRDMEDQDGWDIEGRDTATIAAEKTLTMKNDEGAASNLCIKDTASLTVNGTLAMHDASAIKITSTTDPAFILNGTLDVQNVSNFFGYSGTVSSANASVVYVPYPNATVTAKASDNVFKVSVDQTSGSEVKVRYNTDNAELKTDSTKVYIEVNGGHGTYNDVAAVTEKSGITFGDAANNAVLDPIGKPSFTMAEVVADGVNAEKNVAKTFDVGQAGLSDRNLNTTDATTIHFGLAGTNAVNDVFQYEVGAIEVKGDSSGMNGGIGTNGDLKFTGKAANGNMNVQGALTFGFQGEQEFAGEIKAGAINIPAGSKVVLKNKLTTGWSALKEIDLSKSTNIRDYAVANLHHNTIPGFESTIYYQNKSGDNTEALFYRDASSADPDKLKETYNIFDLINCTRTQTQIILDVQVFGTYIKNDGSESELVYWFHGEKYLGGPEWNGSMTLNFGQGEILPADNVHATTVRLGKAGHSEGVYTKDCTKAYYLTGMNDGYWDERACLDMTGDKYHWVKLEIGVSCF